MISRIVKCVYGTGLFDLFLRPVSGGERNRGSETREERGSKRVT